MSMDWLKLYSEARNDAKLRSLTDAQHRVWFNLLCFAGEQEARGTIPPMPARLLAAEVASANASLLSETLDALSELQIITVVDGVISFRAWEKRQRRKPSDPVIGFPSDRDEWVSLRAELAPLVFARDEHCCVYCGATEDLTVDHVLPLSRGGTNDLSNLVTACRPCNSSKNAKTPEEWEAARR